MHWLLEQLYLTWAEIKTVITIPHIIAGSISYAAVRTIYWFTKREERALVEQIKYNRSRFRRLHTKNGHKGRYRNCEQCQTMQAQRMREWPLELPEK